MKHLLLSFLLPVMLFSNDIKTTDYRELEPHLYDKEKIVITNFWASWCGPCIEELPYFTQLPDLLEKDSSKVEMVFVSLDFESGKGKAEKLIREKKIPGSHFLLKDDPNVWINKIDSTWQGNIPYTLITIPGREPLRINDEFSSAEEIYKHIKPYIE